MTEQRPTPELLRYEVEIPGFSEFDPEKFTRGVRKSLDHSVGRRSRVAVSVSGGVDSTTVAYLLEPVLGNRLYPFFIDDGLRRTIRGEPEANVTASMFRDFPNFEVIHTAEKTLPALEGLSDGRKKREAMISPYLGASNACIEDVGAKYVADGTIRPDIETTASGRQRQHNLDLPYGVTKLELLASLYKPHVRRLAMHLGLPAEFAHKMPCPGPAMLLRVGGKFSEEKLEIAKSATDAFEQFVEALMVAETRRPYIYHEKSGIREPFQYFAYVLGKGIDRIGAAEAKAVLPDDAPRSTCYRTRTEAMWIDPSVEMQTKELYAPVLWVKCDEGPPDYRTLERMRESADRSGLPRMVIELANGGDGFPLVLKCVESSDAMTASCTELDQPSLSALGSVMAGRYRCPVGYEISRKPRATIELF